MGDSAAGKGLAGMGPDVGKAAGIDKSANGWKGVAGPGFGTRWANNHRHQTGGVLSWWAIDLHPDLPACAGCGLCCHLVVELRPDDRVPEELIAWREGAACMDQRGDGACVALDPATLLCTIYDSRPQTCRDFARGSGLCRVMVSRQGAKAPSPVPALGHGVV
jgi:hypothetical protein